MYTVRMKISSRVTKSRVGDGAGVVSSESVTAGGAGGLLIVGAGAGA